MRGAYGAVELAFKTSPNGAWLTNDRGAWVSLQGNITSSPAAALAKDGRLHVIAYGDDGLFARATASSGSPWGFWGRVDAAAAYEGRPSAALHGGVLVVSGRAKDGIAWTTTQTGPAETL